MAKLKNKSGKVKNRKNKLHLVFDEDKRREFLLGFHKRKLQRKKKAEEEMKQQLKEERIRLKQEARERYKKLVISKNAIPDFESETKKEYKTGNVSVNVISLSTDNIAQQNNWIGLNKPQYESENDDNESEDLKNSQVCSDDEEKQFKYKTKKDVKKDLRKQATKTVQKSKIFQRKYKVDKRKMKKKSRVQKNERIKTRIKKGKKNNLNNINN